MYFITTIEHLPQGDYNDMGDIRCVGYYESIDQAEETVITNNCDIWETIYNYCMIEYIKSGLYQYALNDNRWFYKYNKDTQRYEQIDIPRCFDGIIGLAIG